MNRHAPALLVSAVLVSMTACFPATEPRSAIVEKAESAGAGQLAPEVSTQALAQWLAKNRTPAAEIEALCREARPKATARWGDTTEGHLCTASAQVAFFSGGPITSDSRTFQGGSHDK